MKNQSTNENPQAEFYTLEDFRQLTKDTIEASIRKNSIEYIQSILLEEVEALCGKSHKHKRGQL
ncbi:MAG: hypothetical protein KDK39_13250, partial [Leptospiraceae bacterium]|nr:hypothetical protein [Leptospiraceae bacterium]